MSLHPATYMPTKIVLEQAGRSVDTLETGVEATVRLAVAPELEGVTGRFYDRRQEARAHPQAYDADARRRLWELSRELTGRRTCPRPAARACARGRRAAWPRPRAPACGPRRSGRR